MNTKSNYFKIGVFVLGTIVVLVAGIIALSAAELNRDVVLLETYLDESVQGLSVGSRVMQRGVEIGHVKKISFVTREYEMRYGSEQFSKYNKYVLLIMAVEAANFPEASEAKMREFLERSVNNGLRLKLSSQGITGITYIETDFVEPDRYPPMEIEWSPKRLYIPAMPSTLKSFTQSVDTVFQTLESIDFVGMAENLDGAIRSLSQAVEGAEVKRIQDAVMDLVADIRETNRLVQGIVDKSTVGPDAQDRADLADVMQSMNEALKSLGRAAQDIDAARLKEETVGLVSELRQTNQLVQGLVGKPGGDAAGADVPQVLARLDRTLKRMEELLSGRESQIDDILANIGQASMNLLELTETAKKYPSQVIFGNPPPRSEVVK